MNSKTLCFCLSFATAALTPPPASAGPLPCGTGSPICGSVASATIQTAPGLWLTIRKPPAPAPKRGLTPSTRSGFATSTRSGFATWYSRASARREGTGGDRVLMANGKPLRDEALTCAMWLTNSTGRPLRPDGSIVTVRAVGTPASGQKTVSVAWTDNGPGSAPRSRGVIVDLSRAAMLALDPDGLRKGRVAVTVEW